MRAAATLRSTMSSSEPRIYEGVFAIHKPKSISSAQVIRDLQTAFNKSQIFKPSIEEQKRRRDAENRYQQKRRRDKSIRLKIGHGGTLDPLATGVLIIGIGRGTKHLQNFLSCTKSYTTSVLFGAATDTYDILGKVLSTAPYKHITKEKVEAALPQFRGETMQTPPIYSALSQDGKRLYEYAREGKAPPREIQKRPVNVTRLEIVGWEDDHQFRWPKEHAPENERKVAEQVLQLNEVKTDASAAGVETPKGIKRTRDAGDDVGDAQPETKRQQTDSKGDDSGVAGPAQGDGLESLAEKPTGVLDPVNVEDGSPTEKPGNAKLDETSNPVGSGTTAPTDGTGDETSGKAQKQMDADEVPPLVKLDMTVTSGFYVRSLCHDLGKAVGSHGLMAELVRTRQGDYTLGENVFEYDDLAKGEEFWAPKIREMLDGWMEQNPVASSTS